MEGWCVEVASLAVVNCVNTARCRRVVARHLLSKHVEAVAIRIHERRGQASASGSKVPGFLSWSRDGIDIFHISRRIYVFVDRSALLSASAQSIVVWLNHNTIAYNHSCNGVRGDGAAGHGIPLRHVEVAGERRCAHILWRARRVAARTQLWKVRLEVLEECIAGLLRRCSVVNISFQLRFGVVGAAQQITVAVEALQAKGMGCCYAPVSKHGR